MTRQTGIIITVVLAVLIACPSVFCCLFGALTAAGQGTATLGEQTANIPPAYGFVFICVSLIGLIVPVVSWFLLVRGKTA
jgi:ABC-type uncharacterized transport system permease subunit